MNSCKDCKYWHNINPKNKTGICDAVNSILGDKSIEMTFEIEATADDDSNLNADLITGCNFGCIHFQSK